MCRGGMRSFDHISGLRHPSSSSSSSPSSASSNNRTMCGDRNHVSFQIYTHRRTRGLDATRNQAHACAISVRTKTEECRKKTHTHTHAKDLLTLCSTTCVCPKMCACNYVRLYISKKFRAIKHTAHGEEFAHGRARAQRDVLAACTYDARTIADVCVCFCVCVLGAVSWGQHNIETRHEPPECCYWCPEQHVIYYYYLL